MWRVAGLLVVGRMKRHGGGALVVAEKCSRSALSEAKVTKEHTEIEGSLGALVLRIVLGLLRGQADGPRELDLPTNAGTVQNTDVRASRAPLVEFVTPSAVGIKVK